MHSPVEMVQLDDVENTAKLIAAFAQKLSARPLVPPLSPLLLLWDIDGTLLLRATGEHAAALRRAAGAVHGVELRRRAGRGRGPDGRGDRARPAARRRGGRRGDRRARRRGGRGAPSPPTRSCARTISPRTSRPACRRRSPRSPPSRPSTGRRCVTGNLEPVARRKLAARRASAHHFAPGQGGFGSDAEDRGELPAIARARAGGWARERTVVIGDTPRDIACARADRVRVIAVATGPFGAEALADADAVVDGARAVLPVLADWAATAADHLRRSRRRGGSAPPPRAAARRAGTRSRSPRRSPPAALNVWPRSPRAPCV